MTITIGDNKGINYLHVQYYTMNKDNCPNCGAPLKDGIFGTNKILATTVADVINAAQETTTEGFCNKCGNDLFYTSLSKINKELHTLRQQIVTYIQSIPAISIPNPAGWEYEVIGLVTAQSVTGTGIFSEVSMSLSDVLGKESDTMNKKIKEAENTCLTRLKNEAFTLGGNAILALDIDYAEMGSLRGMIMICCTGTAVKVTNSTNISRLANIESEIVYCREKIEKLDAICKPFNTV